VNINQEKQVLHIFAQKEKNTTNIDTQQLVIQIPAKENECKSPTLLVCSSNTNSNNEVDVFTVTLDDLMHQIRQNYANDQEALQRFSYYLVLKAKKIST
jgi:hypothetical protein